MKLFRKVKAVSSSFNKCRPRVSGPNFPQPLPIDDLMALKEYVATTDS